MQIIWELQPTWGIILCYYKKFVIGVDIKKFKLYDVDQPTKDLSDVGKTDDTPPRFGAAANSKSKIDFGGLDFDPD